MNHIDPKASLDTLIRDQLLPLVSDMHDRMATKDDIAEIERRMATKEEVAGLETRLQSMEKRLEKVEWRLDDTATKTDLAHHPTTPFMVGTIITMVLGICSILIGGIAIAPYLRP